MRTMKVQRVVLPWALLSAAFLLGCQEQGSSPAGPEGLAPQFAKEKTCPGHPSCKPGGAPAPSSALDFSDGMITTTGLPVTVKDRTDQLQAEFKAGNTDFVHGITMSFTELELGSCTGFAGTASGKAPTPTEVDALMAELTGTTVDPVYFIMTIDKTSLGLSSGGHLLNVERDGTFDDEPGTTHGTTRIMLGGPFAQVPDVTVAQIGNVFAFTGPVVVWAHGVGGGGGGKSDRIIQCSGRGPQPNKVTVTVNP